MTIKIKFSHLKWTTLVMLSSFVFVEGKTDSTFTSKATITTKSWGTITSPLAVKVGGVA